MGMNQYNFRNFYLGSTRVGKASDLDYFFRAWYNVYNGGFSFSEPWNAKDPALRVPKVCTRVKTRMISIGCDATTASRVIASFKKWYFDTYPNG